MAIPASLQKGLILPIISAPMFLVSGPDLVVEACNAGVIGTFPSLNQRTTEGYREWLHEIKGRLNPDAAAFGVNHIVHPTNPRLMADMMVSVEEKVPLIITSLRTALSGAGLLSAPAFAFSGVGFPLLAMPDSARAWALSMPYTHYARLQIEQLQMGAPIVQSLPVVAGLLLAALVLLLLATAGLARGLSRPDKWGGR